VLRLTSASEAEGRRFEFCLGHHALPPAPDLSRGLELPAVPVMQHLLALRTPERPGQGRKNGK
jgi:hypothetical protein